jgi:ElaB/YqjD/DUF883 family membrane-anchored ribosome-binding protein
MSSLTPPDAPMVHANGTGTEIARLEAEIAWRRDRLDYSLRKLRRRVGEATSWRHWVEARPLTWVAAAASVGFLIGYRGSRGQGRGP